jgi:signal peptidase I
MMRNSNTAATLPIELPVVRLPVRRVLRALFRWTEHVLAMVGLIVVVYWSCFDLSRMVSPSMSPTLQGTSYRNGDLILTERISYRLRQPRRWEVLTFNNDEGLRVMKRVVGLPHEFVSMQRDGIVEIGGVKQSPPPGVPAIKYLRICNLMRDTPVFCGDGYYVLGDDTRDSDDSRFNGPVLPDRVIGQAYLIVWPWSRMGWVNP